VIPIGCLQGFLDKTSMFISIICWIILHHWPKCHWSKIDDWGHPGSVAWIYL